MADPTCSTSPLSQLHKFAYEGSKNKLKNLLKTEQNIDKLDRNGNTALYCACARGAKDCVKLLLENNANPNERCQDNETPMHVAARYGHTKVLVLLLEYGGDLRLHDIHNRTPKTCAMQQENSALRRKTLALIEETRMNAQLQTNKTDAQKLSMLSITPKSRDELVNPCSVGFGILFKSTGEIGMPIVLPVVKENELEHDYGGETFNNGAFMVYESMRWKELHVVTVKRLHSSIADQGHSDLLIEELKYFKKINHCPNILSIMGFCQYVNSEGLMLMFERVQVGSLFSVLHERQLSKRPKLKSICQIMMNVCDALIYLHQMNILHCYVSSHSIFLTTFHTAKLGNLEYAVEKSGDLGKQKKTRVVENKMENCAYNWLAPEILENSIPTELSDMYSYCAVVWELFECRIPWQSCDHIEIQHEMLIKGNMLPVDHEKIAFPFSRIVKDGFSNPIKRMGFEEVRGVLENYQISLHNQSMSKVKLSRLYQRVPRVKANSVTGLETLNSDEVDKMSENSAEYIKCDAYRAEILLKNSGNKKNVQDRTKKLGKLSPVQQLPPTPPSVPPSAKLSSTPQNKILGILSPSPSPRVRPASIDSPRSIKNESLSPKMVHSNLSNVGIRKIEKDIQDNKRRSVNEDIRSRHIEEKNRSYFTKDKFGDFRQNLTEPTPEAKRENYNKNFSSPRLDCGDFARAQRLDYSNLSAEDNNEKNINSKESNNVEQRQSTGFLQELKMKQEQRSQQSSSVESSSTYFQLVHRSGSYSQINESSKRGEHVSRNSTSNQKRSHANSHKPVQYERRSLSHNTATNHSQSKPEPNTPNTEEFFGGHGSVRSLVQSYEEQSAKNDSNPRVEKIRLERLNEMKSLKKQFDQEQAQNQLQKELSTISERTEHTNSINLANTIDSPTGVLINTNSRSATTVTNVVRQLNDKFLDSSTGASGDGASATNRNLSALNSSTPIQTNNLSQTSTRPTAKATIEAIQNLKQERAEIQIPIQFVNKNNSESEDDELFKTSARLDIKKTPDQVNRTKSNQSSQEDYLSNTQPCEVTSMEYSENLYLTDFDRLNSNTPQSSMPRPTLPFDVRKYKFENEMRANEADSSTSSIAAADSVPSLEEDAPIIENTIYKNTKQGNVRLDKHVIDTSKFAGYQYQLETKANVSNKFHIKGLLTNQQTGHSLVVQNTKIRAPSMSTKVVIDKL